MVAFVNSCQRSCRSFDSFSFDALIQVTRLLYSLFHLLSVFKMLFNIVSLAAGLLLLPQQSLAAVVKRQESTGTASAAAPDVPSTTLEPVLPPNNDPEDFDILNPDPKLNLYYGGVPEANIKKRADGDTAVLVNLDTVFLHPSVPLDYSSFISGISCSDDNTLTGILSTEAAYDFVKNAWDGLSNLLLITAADSCGADSQNDVFLANSISFDDDDLSFTATGAEHAFRDVAEKSDITWGNVTPKKLRKRAYKRGVSRTPRKTSYHLY